MDWLLATLNVAEFPVWEETLGLWVAYASFGLLAVEFLRYAVRGRLSWSMIGDAVTNFVTLLMYFAASALLVAGVYVFAYYAAAGFAVFGIPVNPVTVAICIVLADLAYYWEHRFMHRVNLGWATHSVHHSSPYFNLSVAYRFGPLDGFWPIFFHVPLVLAGFHPLVVFFAQIVVQLYQTFLHTEAVGKLPGPVEWLFNTPSHHRVHHGSNDRYLDANYGGIFIVWDRLFGTFVAEDEPVTYGLVRPIPKIDSPGRMLAAPFVAFFHGFWRLGGKLLAARSLREIWMSLFGPPGWSRGRPGSRPGNRRSVSLAARAPDFAAPDFPGLLNRSKK